MIERIQKTKKKLLRTAVTGGLLMAAAVGFMTGVPAAAAEPDTPGASVTAENIAAVTDATIGVGEGYTPSLNQSKDRKFVSMVSESEEIVSVSGKTVRGVSAGVTRVLVSYSDGTEDVWNITVKKAPQSVTLTSSAATLGVGELADLSSKVNDGSSSAERIYTSSNTSVIGIVQIGDTVQAAAYQPGTADITVRTYNGKTAVYKITVKKSPDSIDFAKTTLTIGVGESYTLKSSVNEGSASASNTYRSDNTSVVQVKSKSAGSVTVTGKKQGETYVTVKGYNGVEGVCRVIVKAAPTKAGLSKSSVTLGAGESYQVTSSVNEGSASASRKYTTSNSAVATVESSGSKTCIKAKKAGTTDITVTTYNGKKAVCKVTVKAAPKTVTLNQSSLTIGVGESYTITSSVNSGSAAVKRTYTTSGAAITKVSDKNGLVIKGKKTGTATVTVKTYNGKTAICKVTVKPAPKSVKLNKSQITIGVGESYRLTASVNSGSAVKGGFQCQSGKTAVAAASCSGKTVTITGKKQGKAVITVKTYNGKSVKCTVTVKAAPKKITLGRNQLTLVVGETYTLNSHVNDGAANTSKTYTVSNSSILSVDKNDPNGKITAKKVGTAKVTVKTYNGKTDVCTVKVIKSSVRKKIVDLAKSWVGCNETDGSHKKIIDIYNKGRIPGSYKMAYLDPWCATFVSAVFMKAGQVNLILPSCSCPTMVRGAQARGIWVENDAYVPERGDIIFYNWDDSGKGDCKTGAYHVGIVADVNSGIITVIEGNFDTNNKNGDDTVGIRYKEINGRFIRGFEVPKYPN